MQVKPDQLAGRLRQGLQPVYLVAGNEPLQKLEAVDQIRRSARDAGFKERIVLDADKSFQWSELEIEIRNNSLFSSKKLIELRMAAPKPGKDGAKVLSQFFNAPATDVILLISANAMDSAVKNAKWQKLLNSVGTVVPIWPINGEQIPRWLNGRLKRANLSVNQQGVALLANRVEGNLLAAVQAIELLQLLYGPGSVTAEQIDAAVSDSSRFDVFNLVDACLSGDLTHSVKALETLRQEGVPEVLVLWAITREVRLMCEIGWELSQGGSFGQIAKNRRIWDKRAQQLSRAIKRLRLQRCRQLLSQCLEAEKVIKGCAKGSSWGRLYDLVLAISGHPMLPA